MSSADAKISPEHFATLVHWCFGGPSLLSRTHASCSRHELQAELLDILTVPDNQQLAFEHFCRSQSRPASHRLGAVFERLWAAALEASPHHEVHVANLALRENKHTLGELDLVISDRRQGQVLHIELAVKFYLLSGHGGHEGNWLGPGLQDRLDLKLDRLLGHQLDVCAKAAKLGLLAELPSIDRSVVALKGRLFYPLASGAEGTTERRWPSRIDRDHEFGLWASPSQLGVANPHTERLQLHTLRWRELTKLDWLAPQPRDPGCELHSWLAHNAEPEHPVCLLGTRDGVEALRLFVVPTHWAQNAADVAVGAPCSRADFDTTAP